MKQLYAGMCNLEASIVLATHDHERRESYERVNAVTTKFNKQVQRTAGVGANRAYFPKAHKLFWSIP